jgi:hypothetical protein
MRFDSTTGKLHGSKRSARKAEASKRNATRPRPSRRKALSTEMEKDPFLTPPRSPGRPRKSTLDPAGIRQMQDDARNAILRRFERLG